MSKHFIAGIQQIGIGVADVHKAFDWYRRTLGSDIKIFEEAAEAPLMIKYTGNKVQARRAIFALNMRGGGGFEIWQYTSRTPVGASFELLPGDLGIFAARIKSIDVDASFDILKKKGVSVLSPKVMKDPSGNKHFFIADPFGNIFNIVGSGGWFSSGKELTGGVEGAMVGVSNMERSVAFYKNVLGFDKVIYDKEAVFDDFSCFKRGGNKFRRVLLQHSDTRRGPFSRILGPGSIELVQVFDCAVNKIFTNRYWGDLGFIHLCFDITGMNALKQHCENNGHPFTVESPSDFGMGEAAGHFTYVEDPDGTLIEFVETFKVPVLKKLGIYLRLKGRNPEKPLPNLIVKALALNRVKD